MTSAPHIWMGALLAAVGVALPFADPAPAQVPPVAVTAPRADTVPPPDTIPPDTIPDPELLPDVVGPEEKEEFVPVDFPGFPASPGTGAPHGIWEWDREALLATRGLTLVELLEEVPGMIGLRGGDHGHPAAASAFGLTAGRIRVFLDGFELAPLDGGMPDLARISLGGLDGVRVERRPGEIRVDLRGLQVEEPEPYSLVQAGTGDLNTNFFRGTFAHPDALGGNVVVSLDRIDTDGVQRRTPGAVFGAYLRYSLHRDGGDGVAVEFRRFTTRRPAETFPPRELGRTDWLLRARRSFLSDDLMAELFAGRSSLSVGRDDELDGLAPEVRASFDPGPRSQAGGRLAYTRGPAWGTVSQSVTGGEGWPRTRTGVRAGAEWEDFGGGELRLGREGWAGGSGHELHARVWSPPLAGVTLFVEGGTDRRGVPTIPVETDPDAGEGQGEAEDGVDVHRTSLRFTERTSIRAGADYRREELGLSAAWVGISADSLSPLGMPMDRSESFLPGGDMGGVELTAHLPVPLLEGLGLRGSLTRTLTGQVWRYAPQTVWHGGLTFHNTFFPTENLEVWADLGARGRDRMRSAGEPPEDGAALPPALTPFQPHWFFRLQVRVVTVRAFLNWENITNRMENQDFSDRPLPGMRIIWGIRWTMWD